MNKLLILAGDFSEDYEVMVPFQALKMLGFDVDVVCPGKLSGECIKTAIHDFEGDQTYSEKPGHLFVLNASFRDLNLAEYSGLYITGGRSSEYLRLDARVLHVVDYAIHFALPMAAICHGVQILVAANVLKGRKVTGYPSVKPEVELAGGQWVSACDDGAVTDGNLVTAPTWKAHPELLRAFIHLLGIRFMQKASGSVARLNN
ncbi:DJ-1/PfpI family protein [Celerinatantimonas sp. MCCC 1A17872]|uniref:DJ-1/PfpI family protein n=1 Tax=Celerinatantimonas sp. MCCC 1A17872 TaxID=3177514 RepID=UPI0038C1FC51